MTNTNKSHNEKDDCVEGDTVSEGDTSDEDEIGASTRNTSSFKRNKCLELPSGSADCLGRTRAKRRHLVYVALAIVAVVAISVAVGVGIYASKTSASQSPSTTLEGDSFASSSSPVSSSPNAGYIPSTVENENESVPKDDPLGMLDEIMEHEDEDNSDKKKDDEKEIAKDKEDPFLRSTNWPDLVGMTGEEAKSELELLCGEETYNIIVLHVNSPTTRDYRSSRIRIFTDDEGIVTKVPRTG
jgi:hypothetical protein